VKETLASHPSYRCNRKERKNSFSPSKWGHSISLLFKVSSLKNPAVYFEGLNYINIKNIENGNDLRILALGVRLAKPHY